MPGPGKVLLIAALVYGMAWQVRAAPADAPVDAAPALLPPALVATVQASFELGLDGRVRAVSDITPVPGDLGGRIENFMRSLEFDMTGTEGTSHPRTGRAQLTLVRDVAAGGRVGPIRVENVLFRAIASRPETQPRRRIHPRATKRKAPRYPALALEHDVSGRVLAQAQLRPDGTVDHVLVRQSSLKGVAGEPALLAALVAAFEQEALAALKQWKFRVDVPEGVDASASDLSGLIPIRFELRERRSWASFEWVFQARTSRRASPGTPEEGCCLPGVSDMDREDDYSQFSDRYELASDPRGRLL